MIPAGTSDVKHFSAQEQAPHGMRAAEIKAMNIGWIGTGIMGAAMAGRVQAAGHALHLFNRTRAKAGPLMAAGAQWCASPADVARATFAVRRFKTNGCWRQDGIQAALLGESGTARTNVVMVLTRKDKQCRFPAFWEHGSDYVPDEDNGGNGVNALQLMLLQSEGRKILLLPAWPKNWDCAFKLHAPLQTTVEGRVEQGVITQLRVTPEARRADVVVQPPFTLVSP
jgi:hypothetical protein